MVSQGTVSDEVTQAFAKVSSRELRWVIAKVESSDIVLVASGARDSPLSELAAALGDEPAYVVYDFEGTREDGSGVMKTVFIAYAPDSCKSMQAKFAIQNFKASVKSKINCHKEMQINDKADLTEAEFRDAFNL
uniref:ADF-H domain-containing protein n=1 Tax=Favella ehrenbergii TaxID=182087 RepID=A0A7S3I351_9SPIT|mmetsp:Transcript_31468/g.39115  ORF Transcript_31468/g.39115 Transcript_31468/m.39115 type:complete len:134 (+) Transcript_31468:169-570(+)|eukprot:CAMPEP_0170465458 /NCGR_PEP_ID=MMETSP0123-20130129/9793_1 /TAXON_ID=182087 /ORGANISM="Favella ehrenbergii, Strain Fehren 1" /LENGTH=133 /DNA_ID=CAMNT_0010731357 /DNA_START=168 /DNA_END=569 /DNA_ORIENTATION=+